MSDLVINTNSKFVAADIGNKFFDIAKNGFESSGSSGKCLILLDGIHPLSFVIDGTKLHYSEIKLSNPDVVVKLPTQIFEKLTVSPRTTDLRAPGIVEYIEIEGNSSIFKLLVTFVKRPRPTGLRKFEAVEKFSKNRPQVKNIDYIEAPTKSDIEDIFRQNLPVVISNCIEPVSMIEFEQEHGDTLFHTGFNKPTLLKTFIENCENPHRNKLIYSAGCNVPNKMKNLFKLPFFEKDELLTPQLWLGSSQSKEIPVTPIHRDISLGLLGQFHGRKKVVFWSPDQAEYLYPRKAYNYYQHCRVDPTKPDYDKYPLFRNAKSIEAIIGPGDVLISALGWFHMVYALEPSLSVSQFIKKEYFLEKNQFEV